MALMAALGVAPQGMAQQEMTLTSGNQEHISVTESTDIYVDGDVVFDGLENSACPSGAAISMGSTSKPSEKIALTLKGGDAVRSGSLSFTNNVQEYAFGRQHYGGAIGSEDLRYDIWVTFANLETVTFKNNRLKYVTEPGLLSVPSIGGGSIGVSEVAFSNIREVSFSGSFDWQSYDGGDISIEDINATKGGAIRCNGLQVDNVDKFSVNYILSYGNAEGEGAISASDIDNEDIPVRFYNCGSVDVSHNALMGRLEYDSDSPTGSAFRIDRNSLIFCGNESVTITNNYCSNYATVLVYEGNTGSLGSFECYLNGAVTIADNRADKSHAGVEMYLVDADESGARALLSADLGDITFRNNVGGQKSAESNYATALRFFGGIQGLFQICW